MIPVEMVEKNDVLLRSAIAGFVIFVFAYFQTGFMKLPTFPNPRQLMVCTVPPDEETHETKPNAK